MGAYSRSLAGCGIIAVGLNLGSSGTSNSEVRVEEANVSSFQAGHVDLYKDAARENVCDCEEHVDKLRNTELARLSDLDHGDRVVGVLELRSSGTDLGPNLSVESKIPLADLLPNQERNTCCCNSFYLPTSRRNHKGVADKVRSMREVKNVLAGSAVDDLLKVLGTSEKREHGITTNESFRV